MEEKKTWNRGRKKATESEKEVSREWQKTRVKIANFVSRNPELEKKCCICGNPGDILHNKQDPFYIAFICKDCRKDPNNLLIAEDNRFDIRTRLNTNNLSVSHFNNAQVTRIIVGYMNDRLSIGDYCEKIGISRHQFSLIISRYEHLYPKQWDIKEQINLHSNNIQRTKLTNIIRTKNRK